MGDDVEPFQLTQPKQVVIATSVASRPRAINTRPIRGTKFRASNVYHWLPTNTSIQALKSIGAP